MPPVVSSLQPETPSKTSTQTSAVHLLNMIPPSRWPASSAGWLDVSGHGWTPAVECFLPRRLGAGQGLLHTPRQQRRITSRKQRGGARLTSPRVDIRCFSGILDLSAAEFIRRFLLHVLPRGFVRIRHYGLLAARNVHTKLDAARKILGTPTPDDDPDLNLPWWQRLLRLTGIDLMLCPYCHQGRLTRTQLANEPVTISRGPPS